MVELVIFGDVENASRNRGVWFASAGCLWKIAIRAIWLVACCCWPVFAVRVVSLDVLVHFGPNPS